MEELRQRIHEALNIEPMGPDLASRVLSSVATDTQSIGRHWFTEIIVAVAAIIAAFLVAAVTIGLHSRQDKSQVGPSVPGALAALPVCGSRQVDLSSSIERRIGTRFSFITITPINRGVPCHLRLQLTVTLANAAGAPVDVAGNPATTVVAGDLPGDRPLAAYSWANWCGTPPHLILETPGSDPQLQEILAGSTPPCTATDGENGTPSILEPAIASDPPKTGSVSTGIAYHFMLLAHCGLQVVDFNASYWDLVAGQSLPGLNLQGNMTLLDQSRARFDFGGGTLYFSRHRGPLIVDPRSLLCD